MIRIAWTVLAAAMLSAAAQQPVTTRQFAAGRASLERKDYPAAVWAFRQVLLADPSDDEARRLLAKALYEQSYQRGLGAIEQGDWSRAEQAFLDALDAAPDSRDAREKLRAARCELASDLPALEDCRNPSAQKKIAALRFQQQRLAWLRSGNFLQLDRTGGVSGLGPGPAVDRYLAGRKRRAFFERWAMPMAVAYLMLLLVGTWLGLRQMAREAA